MCVEVCQSLTRRASALREWNVVGGYQYFGAPNCLILQAAKRNMIPPVHAMKARKGNGGTASLILDLGTR
jgi:hypothetical protein